jgi:hypothetical protein
MTITEFRKSATILGHRFTSISVQTVDGVVDSDIRFNLFGSLYHKARIDTNVFPDGTVMVSLSVNGWLQTVGMLNSTDEILSWFNQAVKNYQIK